MEKEAEHEYQRNQNQNSVERHDRRDGDDHLVRDDNLLGDNGGNEREGRYHGSSERRGGWEIKRGGEERRDGEGGGMRKGGGGEGGGEGGRMAGINCDGNVELCRREKTNENWKLNEGNYGFNPTSQEDTQNKEVEREIEKEFHTSEDGHAENGLGGERSKGMTHGQDDSLLSSNDKGKKFSVLDKSTRTYEIFI